MKQLRQRTKINFLKEEPSKEAIEKDKEICQALKKTETELLIPSTKTNSSWKQHRQRMEQT